jgi:hypothetical protein
VRPNTTISDVIGVNPISYNSLGLNVTRIIQQGFFLHLILSYLDLERNRDRGATVPPVRFSRTARFRMGFVVEFFSRVESLRALANAIIRRVRRGGAPEGPAGLGNHGRDKVAFSTQRKINAKKDPSMSLRTNVYIVDSLYTASFEARLP